MTLLQFWVVDRSVNSQDSKIIISDNENLTYERKFKDLRILQFFYNLYIFTQKFREDPKFYFCTNSVRSV